MTSLVTKQPSRNRVQSNEYLLTFPASSSDFIACFVYKFFVYTSHLPSQNCYHPEFMNPAALYQFDMKVNR